MKEGQGEAAGDLLSLHGQVWRRGKEAITTRENKDGETEENITVI